MIINAENLVVGRMATVVAKKALLGEKIDIINCEKAIIIGSKKEVLEKYKIKSTRGGPFKGPFISRMPDRFVRRIIRGMLPYKQYKGKKAFDNVMCHISIPNEFKNKETEKIKNADISRIKTLKYINIGDICKFLKGNKND